MNWAKPRRKWLIALATLLVLGSAGLAGCRSDSPEQALRMQLQAMQTAVEQRDGSEFMAGVDEDFSGNEGMDRAALHNLLRLQMLANNRLGATTGPLDIQLQGDRATVRFDVLLTGGNGRLLPDSAQAYAVTSGWRLQDGKWRVYYAQWQPKL